MNIKKITYFKTFLILSKITSSTLVSVILLLFTMNGVWPISLENFKYLPAKYNGAALNFILHVGTIWGYGGGTGYIALNSSSEQDLRNSSI